MENITYEMIPEFEFDTETSNKFNAWAYLSSIEDGMSLEDGLLVYGLTKEQAEPYKKEYSKLKENENKP